jgi:hypothetical protein
MNLRTICVPVTRWAACASAEGVSRPTIAGGFVDEFVVFEGLDHEPGEVDAACDVALEDRVAGVWAPDGQALALAQAAAEPQRDADPLTRRAKTATRGQ